MSPPGRHWQLFLKTETEKSSLSSSGVFLTLNFRASLLLGMGHLHALLELQLLKQELGQLWSGSPIFGCASVPDLLQSSILFE